MSRWKSAFAKNKQDFAEIAREAVEEWAEGSASLDPLMVERILSELATPEPVSPCTVPFLSVSDNISSVVEDVSLRIHGTPFHL